MSEDSKFFNDSLGEDHYDINFKCLYNDDNRFIERKKINESYNYLNDESEHNFEDINKGFDCFNLNLIDDNNDEKKTYFISCKNEQENNKELFILQKIMHKKIIKKGRKNSKESTLFKSKHDKNSSDNMRKKIKRQFIKSITKYINKLYIKYLSQRNKKHEKLIYKIIPNFCNSSKKEDKEKYLSMTLRELFSSDLGRKFKKINKDSNKNKIDKLYQKNKSKEIIELLNKTIKEVYEIYINNKIPEFSLDNDLKEIEKEKGIDDAKIFKTRAKKLMENPKKKEE